MRVEWYGQSAFRLEHDGVTVAIDPFGDLGQHALPPEQLAALGHVDVLPDGDGLLAVVPAAP